uniref:Uncharacterized protein n=1 Tax=Zea mays TaxID=4577 RepID=C0PAI1_MAIZE|nr:unknown [Zea mays]
MNYIMTSSSLLTRYQGTPNQDKDIRSSNQDQCTAHNATIVLPHLYHNLLEQDLDSLCTWGRYQTPHPFLHLCCHDQQHYCLDLMVQFFYWHLFLLLIVDKSSPIGTAHH